MNPPAAEAAVKAAAVELAALAVAVRPDWDPAVVDGVIQGARDSKMTWPQVLVGLPRLMADASADPRDLLKAHAAPLERRHGTEPPAEWRAARQRLDALRAGREPEALVTGDIWTDLTCPVCGYGEAINCGLYSDNEPDSPPDEEYPFRRLMTCTNCHKMFDIDAASKTAEPAALAAVPDDWGHAS